MVYVLLRPDDYDEEFQPGATVSCVANAAPPVKRPATPPLTGVYSTSNWPAASAYP
jgi:hypothetical protein